MNEITVEQFEERLKISKPFVLHFWAEWNCYDFEQKKYLEEVDREFDGVDFYQMSIDPKENHEIAKNHNVMGPPTVVFYRGGKLKNRMVGVMSVERITQAVKKLNGA